MRAFASRALASRGYTVLEAETGLDAARRRGRKRADRPRRLRRHHAGNGRADDADGTAQARIDGKVIFVSGYADDAFARNLPEGQDFVFLPKPFSLKQLIETVKGLMN